MNVLRITRSLLLKFWSSERNIENSMSRLYFNEKSDYSQDNKCKNEVFVSTIERN